MEILLIHSWTRKLLFLLGKRLRADPESFFQKGSNFFFILVNDWFQIPLKSGHHQPTSESPLKWRFAGVPIMAKHWMLAWYYSFVIFQWIRINIAKKPYTFMKPYILWFFRLGGGGGPDPLHHPSPPLWIRIWRFWFCHPNHYHIFNFYFIHCFLNAYNLSFTIP